MMDFFISVGLNVTCDQTVTQEGGVVLNAEHYWGWKGEMKLAGFS